MSQETHAATIEEVLPGVLRWEVYSPGHKVHLTSHAVVVEGRLYCFDPVPLADEAFKSLLEHGRPEAVVLTNGNHERDSLSWKERWQVPVWAPDGSGLEEVTRFPTGQAGWSGWMLHPLPGGGAGETAFRLADQSLMVFGDAVVNLPARGLELLPDKYCADPASMRSHLRALLVAPFERMVMAHGAPVLEGASRRLAALA